MLGAPLFRPRRVLMRAHGRAVDKVDFPLDIVMLVSVYLHLLKDALPQPVFAPLVEAPIHGLPGTISLGQVAPWCTRTQNPKNSINDLAVVGSGTTSIRLLGWQQRFDLLPLFVRQFMSVTHTFMLGRETEFSNAP